MARRRPTWLVVGLAVALGFGAATTAGAEAAPSVTTTPTTPTACTAGWTEDHVGLPPTFRGYDLDVVPGATVLVGTQGARGALATRSAGRWQATSVPGTIAAYTVTATAPDDVWVNGIDGAYADVLAHRVRGVWRTVPLPGWLSGDLTSVNSMVATSDGLWVASLQFTDDGARPVLGRYDGTRWLRVPGDLPDGSPYSVVLELAASPTGRVWMVGEDVEVDTVKRTAWAATVDGGKAVRVDVPQPAGGQSTLLTTVAFAPDGAVVVGGWQGLEERRQQPLLLRRNGSGWTRVVLPDAVPGSQVRSVDALARIGTTLWSATGVGQVGEVSMALQPAVPRVGSQVTPGRFRLHRPLAADGLAGGAGWVLTWFDETNRFDSGDMTRLWRPC